MPLDIAKKYLILASSRLKRSIKKESQPVLKTFAAFPDALDTIISSLSKMNDVVLKDFSTFAECFDSFFLTARESSLINPIDGIDGEGLELVKNLFGKKLAVDVTFQLQKDFEECFLDVENEYLTSISALLKVPVKYFFIRFRMI
jgi:hypothetical protein